MSDGDRGYRKVLWARSLAEADLVKGLLVANGIAAIIDGEQSVAMLNGMVTGNRGVRILVPAEDLETAEFVLQSSRGGHEEE